MFLLSEKSLKAEFPRSIKSIARLSNRHMLRLFTCIFSIIPVLAILFMDIVFRQDNLLPKAIGLTGMNIFSSLGSGTLQVYSLGSVYKLVVPSYTVMLIIAIIILQIAASLLSFLSDKSRKASGYISLVTSVAMSVSGSYCISPDHHYAKAK